MIHSPIRKVTLLQEDASWKTVVRRVALQAFDSTIPHPALKTIFDLNFSQSSHETASLLLVCLAALTGLKTRPITDCKSEKFGSYVESLKLFQGAIVANASLVNMLSGHHTALIVSTL